MSDIVNFNSGPLRIDILVDETLREGVERSAFAVDDDNRYALLEKMVDAGLREFVLGISPERPRLLQKCLESKANGHLPTDARFVFIALLNSWETTYDYLALLPREHLQDFILSFGMIDLRSQEQLLEKVVESFRSMGINSFKASILVNFRPGLSDEIYERIVGQVRRCLDNGISTIRINDSIGALYPETTTVLCKQLVTDFPGINFCLHAHDDRGLALANALASVSAGFNMIEGTLAGLGNRAGMPSMELIAKIAEERNIQFGNCVLNTSKLIESSRFADEMFMNMPNVYRPVSGWFVNNVNFGPLNIPDYLNVKGERKYVLNIAALHPKTIREALKATQFDGRLTHDDKFISDLMDLLEVRLIQTYREKQPEYKTLLHQFKTLYDACWLELADIHEAASALASTAGAA